MTNSILSFLGHGGFKLLLLGFFFIMKIVRANAKKTKDNENKLRGNTGISDFSAPPTQATSKTPSPLPNPASLITQKPTFPTSSKPPVAAPDSVSGSPWSSNQNPFDSKKS